MRVVLIGVCLSGKIHGKKKEKERKINKKGGHRGIMVCGQFLSSVSMTVGRVPATLDTCRYLRDSSASRRLLPKSNRYKGGGGSIVSSISCTFKDTIVDNRWNI